MTAQAPPPELRLLIDRLLDEGGLSRTEMARLEELLETPGHLAYYLAVTTQDGLMPEALASTTVALPRARRIAWWWPAAGAAAAGLVFFIGFWTGRRPETRIAQAAQAQGVARITGLVGVEWDANAAPDLSGAAGKSQRLAFRTGLAELTYANGVRVTVEGPADLTVTGNNTARLDAGRMVAAVPKGAEGFTVDYAGGKVVDLGTEFGLDLTAAGKTELGVFEGEVELHRPDSPVLSLLKNQAVVLEPGAKEAKDEVSAIPLNRDKFVRQIPNRDFRWEVNSAGPMQVEFDVSHLVWKGGSYRALFKWMQGGDAVRVRKVELCRDGMPVVMSSHEGVTGELAYVRDNLVELDLAQKQFQRGRWTLRATLEAYPRTAAVLRLNPPYRSLGIMQFEEGLVSKATAADFIGRWEYRYAGAKFVRQINADGTIAFFKDGKIDPSGFPGGTWKVEQGVLRLMDPVRKLHEDHVLRDRDTLIFVSQPYDYAHRQREE